MNLGAIILAAGLSSRMGAFKPLLEVDGQALLLKEIKLLLSCGIQQIVVVSGNRHADICACLSVLPEYGGKVVVAHNAHFHEGMFSSVLIGVAALEKKLDAFYLLPADCPGVTQQTILALRDALEAQPCAVVYPVYQGRRGHPPLISSQVLPELLAWHGEGGLKQFLRSCVGCEVAVEDWNVMNDLDTPADYIRYMDNNC